MAITNTLTELYVHESGTPGSPAIVVLHADAASGGMWDQHLRRLTGYHCLAPDLRHMYLGEPDAEAAARYEKCERSQGRVPLVTYRPEPR